MQPPGAVEARTTGTYWVNQQNGQLTPLDSYTGGDGPMWILMNRLLA